MDDPVQTQQAPQNNEKCASEDQPMDKNQTDTAKVGQPNGHLSTSALPDGQPPVPQDNIQQQYSKGNDVTQDANKIACSTGDNTIQQTQKEVSAAKSERDDLSSPSDEDQPDDYMRTTKAAPKDADQPLKTDQQAVPNHQSAHSLPNQSMAQQNDTVQKMNQTEEKNDAQLQNQAPVAQKDPEQKETAPQPPAASASDANILQESQKPSDARPNDETKDKIIDENQKSTNGANQEPEKVDTNQPVDAQRNGELAAVSSAQKDADMKDINEQEPKQANDQSIKQEENKPDSVAQVNEPQPGQSIKDNQIQSNSEPKLVEKSQTDAQTKLDQTSKAITQSQLLWGKGVPQKDANMQDDEDDQDEISNESDNDIDKELKQKCLAAQDPDKLFTLNINTYKVCQLNIILSSLGLKMEPKEQVLKFQKQKERDERNRKIREDKIQQKMAKQKYNWQNKKHRDYQNQEMMSMVNKPQAEDVYNSQYYKSSNMKDYNGTSKPESSHHLNDPQSMSASVTHGDKDTKIGSSDAQMMNAGDKQMDHGGEATSSKDQPQNPVSGAAGSANAELKGGTSSPDPKHLNELDLKTLSPTIRKSERDKTPVSYEKMNKGGLSESDEDNTNVADPNQAGHIQGASNGQKHKKSQEQMHNAAKKHTIEDANKRIQEMFSKLSQHQHKDLMNQPLSNKCALFEQYKNEYKTLIELEMRYRCRQYQNSKDILSDINEMILIKFSYLSKTGESEDSMKVHEFQQYFDNIVKQQSLNNLVLANKPEQKPKSKPQKPIAENHGVDQNKDKKKKAKTNTFKNDESTNKEGLLDDGPTVIPCKPAVQPLTAEQLAQLKRDIVELKEEQRADIEKVVPECITMNAAGNKNIELNRLQQNPETAAKLVKYVQTQTKKNQQRERRRQIDIRRRQLKKQSLTAKQPRAQGTVTPDVSYPNAADPTKQAVTAHAPVAAIQGAQAQTGQDLLTAQAQAMQQAQLQQNPQLAQFGLGTAAFNNKTAGLMSNPLQMAAGGQQAAQHQLLQQMMMNGMNGLLGQQGMNPAAAMQQLTAMFQMQQAQAQQVQQKQAQNAGQVGGMQPQDSQNTQMPAVPKKAAPKPPAPDDGSSSSSDSESV